MKLIIQIPCFNEAESLPATLMALPRQVSGFDSVEYLVIDDGSEDDTSGVARRFGAHHVVRHRRNRGLAAAFQTGINAALEAKADVIVNTDADGQYEEQDIPLLVQPILEGRADIVVGDRQVGKNQHFGPFKRKLQVLGSLLVRKLSKTPVTDAVSGFRAISREAAQRTYIVSSFSYTTEMLIQAGRKRLAVISVPIRTNAVSRPSRLFKSIPQFIMNSGLTILRAYAMYNPLRVFVAIGLVAATLGVLPIIRFLYLYAIGDGSGHIQSLVVGGSLLTLGVIAIMFGVVADLIGRNRQLVELTLERLHELEHKLSSDQQESSDRAVQETSARYGTDG